MRPFVLISALAFALSSAHLAAQAPAPLTNPVQVKMGRTIVSEQPTPQFSGGVKEKRWRPKNWIEVDVEFDIKLPADAGGNKGSYGSLQVNVYLATQHVTKDNKRAVFKGSFDVTSIPAGEPCHVLAYVSPANLRAIFQKDNVTASTDIQGWGVEILAEGQRIAGDSSLGKGAWWETGKDAFVIMENMLVHKSKTPFGILWGDYDLPVKTGP
ncbi:MAG TPA: Amuc_1102 family pilus-like protein [Prosthecobacter sp.]